MSILGSHVSMQSIVMSKDWQDLEVWCEGREDPEQFEGGGDEMGEKDESREGRSLPFGPVVQCDTLIPQAPFVAEAHLMFHSISCSYIFSLALLISSTRSSDRSVDNRSRPFYSAGFCISLDSHSNTRG